MADENTNPNPTETTTTTVVETPPPTGTQPTGERTFTQADVDRIVKERLARANPRPAEPARTNVQTAAPPQNTQPASSPAPAVTYDAEALSDSLAEFSFDKEQRAEIRAAARRDNPSDVDAFVAKWGRMFGKQPGSPATATPAATAPVQVQPVTTAVPGTPPVTSRGTPPPAGTPTDDTPIMSMSEADKRALAARIGDKAFAERHLKELVKSNTRIRPRP